MGAEQGGKRMCKDELSQDRLAEHRLGEILARDGFPVIGTPFVTENTVLCLHSYIYSTDSDSERYWGDRDE